MSTDESMFSPMIDTGIFDETDGSVVADVVVPLMLCRSVAEMPQTPGLADQVARLQEELSAAREYPFAMQAQGVREPLGITLFPANRHARVRGCNAAGDRAKALALTAEGLHLLHGHLTFFVHHLAMTISPEHPYRDTLGATRNPAENPDVEAVRDALVGEVDAAATEQRLVLFAVKANDTMGRPLVVTAAWYPNKDRTSWEWEAESAYFSGAVYFPLHYAAELVGFLTLLRMAQPEWGWEEKKGRK